MNADDFRIGVFHGDEDIGPAFLDGDRLRHVCSPHFIDLVGDDRSIVRLALGASNAMRSERETKTTNHKRCGRRGFRLHHAGVF